MSKPPEWHVAPLSILSWNLWNGGTNVHDGHTKQLAYLSECGADIVALQETYDYAGRDLARDLGWEYHQGPNQAIITPHRILERFTVEDQPAVGVRVQAGPAGVVLWSVHLYYEPYGPYDVAEGCSVEEVLANEEISTRPAQIKAILTGIADTTGDPRVAAFLTGDFNAPSHLDRPDVPWPVSIAVHEDGWRDSFRDVRSDPGFTWSPIVKSRPVAAYPEPQDRIDFVYYRGPATVTGSRTVITGDPRPVPDHRYNTWPSDHAGVLSTFELS